MIERGGLKRGLFKGPASSETFSLASEVAKTSTSNMCSASTGVIQGPGVAFRPNLGLKPQIGQKIG